MKWFLYAFSLIWIAYGAWMILYTDPSRKVLKNLMTDLDHRILGVLTAVIGILFLFAASWSRQPWFIRLLGIVSTLKGGFLFWNPNNLSHKIMDWYLNTLSNQTYRFFGIIALILGTVILSWIL